jgi:uncharacterized protein YbjT (DUF2867 family)
VEVYVLVSTVGANATSIMPYPKMKDELAKAVKTLDFEHTISYGPG